jgi:hypothetical protein
MAIATDDDVTDNGIVVAEGFAQFINNLLVAFDVQQHIMGFVDFVDRVGELATTPIF